MNPRAALAFAGSATTAAALDGAARTLTSAPPALALCAGIALCVFAVRPFTRRTSVPALLAGACAGMWLPNVPPSNPHDVSVRAPRGHIAADLFDALDRLDTDPSAFDGRTISVSGEWMPSSVRGAATISRRVMSCCAADAIDVGFDVAPSGTVRVRAGEWARVSGRVRVRLRDGDMRYEIDAATVRPAPQ